MYRMLRAGPRSPAVVLGSSPLAALREVALEGVADQREPKHGETEGHTGEESDPPLASDHVLAPLASVRPSVPKATPHTPTEQRTGSSMSQSTNSPALAVKIRNISRALDESPTGQENALGRWASSF